MCYSRAAKHRRYISLYFLLYFRNEIRNNLRNQFGSLFIRRRRVMHVQDLSIHLSHCKTPVIMQLRQRYHPARQPQTRVQRIQLEINLIQFNW